MAHPALPCQSMQTGAHPSRHRVAPHSPSMVSVSATLTARRRRSLRVRQCSSGASSLLHLCCCWRSSALLCAAWMPPASTLPSSGEWRRGAQQQKQQLLLLLAPLLAPLLARQPRRAAQVATLHQPRALVSQLPPKTTARARPHHLPRGCRPQARVPCRRRAPSRSCPSRSLRCCARSSTLRSVKGSIPRRLVQCPPPRSSRLRAVASGDLIRPVTAGPAARPHRRPHRRPCGHSTRRHSRARTAPTTPPCPQLLLRHSTPPSQWLRVVAGARREGGSCCARAYQAW